MCRGFNPQRAAELRTFQVSQSVARLKTPCTEQLAISTHAEIQGVAFALSLAKCLFLYTFLYIEQGFPLSEEDLKGRA